MNSPCAFDVPAPSEVRTFSCPGYRTATIPAAAIPPTIWETTTKAPLSGGTAPTMTIPKVTAGLNKPPLILKNTQAFTARLKPKQRLIYSNWAGLDPWAIVVEVVPCVWEFATCVPVKAKKRKRKVPANSPAIAIMWFLIALCGPPGMKAKPRLLAEDALWFMPANTKPRVRWDESAMMVKDWSQRDHPVRTICTREVKWKQMIVTARKVVSKPWRDKSQPLGVERKIQTKGRHGRLAHDGRVTQPIMERHCWLLFPSFSLAGRASIWSLKP